MGESRSTDRQSGRRVLGRDAEEAIAARLVASGHQILARNARVGRLELDIVARRGMTIVVCEVRARSTARLVHPAQTVTPAKQARVREAASRWLAEHNELAPYSGVRFDVAAVIASRGRLEVEYYEGCF